MMRLLFLPLVFLTVLHAEDLTLTDGKVYKDVTIRKVEPDGLAITHSTGLAKVPFTKLSKTIQAKHGYDAAKARAAAEAEEIEAKEKEKRRLASLPWNERFFILERPSEDSFCSVKFESPADLAEALVERRRLELVPAAEIAEELAELKTGGLLTVKVTAVTIGAADGQYYSVIVRDAEGKEIARIKEGSAVPEPPQGDGLWWNLLGGYLPRELRGGDQIRVADWLQKRSVDFLVVERRFSGGG